MAAVGPRRRVVPSSWRRGGPNLVALDTERPCQRQRWRWGKAVVAVVERLKNEAGEEWEGWGWTAVVR